MRNKFIEIKQYLQSIKKLLKSSNTSYIAKNSKRRNKKNRSLCKQNNLFSAINNTNNFIILIIKITIII